jgi:flagellar hook-associated protein 2
MDLGISGLASGFDWKTLVSQLTQVERTPQKQLLTEQSKLTQRGSAYGSIITELKALQTRVDALKDATLFQSRLATSSDTSTATAASATNGAKGSYTFNVTQMATAAQLRGASNAGARLSSVDITASSPEPDTSPTLAAAGFATPITAGTIMINGQQITLETTDTLRTVFQKIATATAGHGDVVASYAADTDKIILTSASGPIVVGSPNDASNFLQVARLNFNGTGTVSSSAQLGSIKLTAPLNQANSSTSINDGGSGAGRFKVNGVEIAFSASADSMADVLARINSSTAGVTASYDAANDQVVLTNKATGDSGIALEDVAGGGNFLAATGLSSGTLTRGANLTYTVNDGGLLTSPSNTITDSSSGLTGLSVTVLKNGTATINVASDTSKIKTTVTDFISAYNKVQALISTQTASSTDAKGVVTAGTLSSERDADEVAAQLRSLAFSEVSGLSGTMKSLAAMGISTGGYDDLLTLSDSTALDTALADNLDQVKSVFADSTNGVAVRLSAFINKTAGDDGTLVGRQASMTTQSSKIDTQVAEMERIVLANQERLTNSFIAMEKAQAQINQQLAYLTKTFG